MPLTVKGDRLLDIIAQAGGVKMQVNEIYVLLQRGGGAPGLVYCLALVAITFTAGRNRLGWRCGIGRC